MRWWGWVVMTAIVAVLAVLWAGLIGLVRAISYQGLGR